MFTCEHVIAEKLIEKKSSTFITYDYRDNNKKDFIIPLDDKNRFIRSYLYLGIDATVVQIFPDKDEIKKELFYEYDIYDMENLINDNYKELQKKNIKIFQFPGGEINDLNYSSGQFFDIFYINRFIHRALTLSGSSGSPILYYYNGKFIIFGIHKGSGKNKYFGKIEINLTEEKYINYGHFIYPIIDSLRKNNDIFIKTKEFTAEIFNNEQKGVLLI